MKLVSQRRNRSGVVDVKTAFLMFVGVVSGVVAAFVVNNSLQNSDSSPAKHRQAAVKKVKNKLSGGFTEEQNEQIRRNLNNRAYSAQIGM